ncbi:hypothetical protein MiYa_04661 [Microcystis aeruginosa NIES-2519]|uniref:Uncharacterized protein n=1 Tax=Microcystis aeruginosa NIES-2519 TaxID=2303981 RepID=A0A5A5RIS2_MICAE|nr:hypothetical protein MiYa_04661 [Microcystis aeruginosa NIES-2519]GCA86581.1 hypothetical protein MiHa_04575 [Microcystis aeruginosa NIES-2522]
MPPYRTITSNEEPQSSSPVDWQFTTEDARIKLTKLYPSILT